MFTIRSLYVGVTGRTDILMSCRLISICLNPFGFQTESNKSFHLTVSKGFSLNFYSILFGEYLGQILSKWLETLSHKTSDDTPTMLLPLLKFDSSKAQLQTTQSKNLTRVKAASIFRLLEMSSLLQKVGLLSVKVGVIWCIQGIFTY